jgi:hypothetical protein
MATAAGGTIGIARRLHCGLLENGEECMCPFAVVYDAKDDYNAQCIECGKLYSSGVMSTEEAALLFASTDQLLVPESRDYSQQFVYGFFTMLRTQFGIVRWTQVQALIRVIYREYRRMNYTILRGDPSQRTMVILQLPLNMDVYIPLAVTLLRKHSWNVTAAIQHPLILK